MDVVEPVAGRRRCQLIIAALAGIAVIVLLITLLKLHPFIALILGALTVGIIAGEDVNDVLASFTTGFGTTAAGVGALIALGAMFAKLLADSGGADQIVDTIVGSASGRMLPWAMAGVGALIGLPMFFEIGLVLLMPVIYLVSQARPGLADHRRHPGAGRPVRDARLRAAAPGAGHRDRLPRRQPRRHARARPRRRGADDHRRRPALRGHRRPLGRRSRRRTRSTTRSATSRSPARRSASPSPPSCCPSC